MNNLALQTPESAFRDGRNRQALVIENGAYQLIPEHLVTEGMRRVSDEFEMAVHAEHGVVYVERIKGSWAIRQSHAILAPVNPEALRPIEFFVIEKFKNAAYPFDHVDVRDPHPEVREFMRDAVHPQDSNTKQICEKAAAFLHCNHPHRVVIEFWSDEHADFMEYLNSGFERWYAAKIENMYASNIDVLSYNELVKEKARIIKMRSDGKLCDCCDSLLKNDEK